MLSMVTLRPHSRSPLTDGERLLLGNVCFDDISSDVKIAKNSLLVAMRKWKSEHSGQQTSREESNN